MNITQAMLDACYPTMCQLCGSPKSIITTAWPVSANNMNQGMGKNRRRTKAYRDYIANVAADVLEAKIKGQMKPIEKPALFACYFALSAPEAIKGWDDDNRIKPLLDALESQGVIWNDKAMRWHGGGRIPASDYGAVTVYIWQLPEG